MWYLRITLVFPLLYGLHLLLLVYLQYLGNTSVPDSDIVIRLSTYAAETCYSGQTGWGNTWKGFLLSSAGQNHSEELPSLQGHMITINAKMLYHILITQPSETTVHTGMRDSSLWQRFTAGDYCNQPYGNARWDQNLICQYTVCVIYFVCDSKSQFSSW